MFLSKLSINRPVMVTMGLLIFVVFGLMAYFSLSLNFKIQADSILWFGHSGPFSSF